MANAGRPGQSVRENPSKGVTRTLSPTRAESTKAGKTTILARNTSPKTGPDAATAKPKVEGKKKTVGHYWRQLMSTFREVSHAHRTRK